MAVKGASVRGSLGTKAKPHTMVGFCGVVTLYELRHPLRNVPETWFTLSALFYEAGGRDAMEGAFCNGCLRFIQPPKWLRG
jgi:hypothetical protein